METRIDAYIRALANYLAQPRKASSVILGMGGNRGEKYEDRFTLEGHRFEVIEYEFADPMTLETTRAINVWSCDCPDLDRMSVSYNPGFWKRPADSESRPKACIKLAELVVKELLPKVDYRFKAMIHNDEIEDILSVL